MNINLAQDSVLAERLLIKQWTKCIVDFNSIHSMPILQTSYEDLLCVWSFGLFVGFRNLG